MSRSTSSSSRRSRLSSTSSRLRRSVRTAARNRSGCVPAGGGGETVQIGQGGAQLPVGPGDQGADGDARVVLMEVESGHHRDAQLQPDHGQDGQFILGGPTDVGVNARLLDHPGDVVVIGPVFQDEGFAGQLG